MELVDRNSGTYSVLGSEIVTARIGAIIGNRPDLLNSMPTQPGEIRRNEVETVVVGNALLLNGLSEHYKRTMDEPSQPFKLIVTSVEECVKTGLEALESALDSRAADPDS